MRGPAHQADMRCWADAVVVMVSRLEDAHGRLSGWAAAAAARAKAMALATYRRMEIKEHAGRAASRSGGPDGLAGGCGGD